MSHCHLKTPIPLNSLTIFIIRIYLVCSLVLVNGPLCEFPCDIRCKKKKGYTNKNVHLFKFEVWFLGSAGKVVKKEPEQEEGQQNFDEAAKLLQEFQDAQVDRVGSRPSSNLSSLSNTSERDPHHLGKGPLRALKAIISFGRLIVLPVTDRLRVLFFSFPLQGVHPIWVWVTSQRWFMTPMSSCSLQNQAPRPTAETYTHTHTHTLCQDLTTSWC